MANNRTQGRSGAQRMAPVATTMAQRVLSQQQLTQYQMLLQAFQVLNDAKSADVNYTEELNTLAASIVALATGAE